MCVNQKQTNKKTCKNDENILDFERKINMNICVYEHY